MNNKKDREEDINILKNLKETLYENAEFMRKENKTFYEELINIYIKRVQALENILADREKYKRLAEQNLKDSEEFKNNMCEHRCVKNTEIIELQAKANKYDSLIKEIKDKIEDLDKIAKKKDVIPETVKEEKLDGSYVYSQRFTADGYIAEAIINVLQELLDTEKEKI